MKITVSRVTCVDVEVEIPDKCPDCKIDFREHGSLSEQGWVAADWDCRIVQEEGKDALDFEGSRDDRPDDEIVTGYRCSGCGTRLATTEEK